MDHRPIPRLDRKKRYLQVALNSTLGQAKKIIDQLPASDRILIEVGTPLIKRYGMNAVEKLNKWWRWRISGSWGVGSDSFVRVESLEQPHSLGEAVGLMEELFGAYRNVGVSKYRNIAHPVQSAPAPFVPYVVADIKTMDRGETEVQMSARAGASGVIALGTAPAETLNAFVEACDKYKVDAMIDMMNVEYPLATLRKLKKQPAVVLLHRGVDEEQFNKEKQIPLHEIRRIKGNYDIMISIAGGDTLREAQRAIFNDADIVVIWKSVYQSVADTAKLVQEFLKEIK